MQKFQIRLNRRNVPIGEIVTDLRRIAEEIQCSTLTASQYDERGEFSSTLVIRKFGSWNKGLTQAGLEIVNRQGIPAAELFENIAAVWVKLGRQPTREQMSCTELGALFSSSTYKYRFGTWNKALAAFSKFIDQADAGADDSISTLSRISADQKLRAKRSSRDINWRLRAKILIRDSCICKMCGASPAKNSDTVLHVDHIFAWANGGETVEENLQTLCAKCNIGKSDEMF